MTVSDKISRVTSKLSDKENLLFLLKIILSFSGGVICCVPYFCHSFSPFAASLPCALNGWFSVFSALGGILGVFVFHSGVSAFRYFALISVSTVILHICNEFFTVDKERILRPLCPGICSLIINCAFLFSQKPGADLIFTALSEVLICAPGVIVFRDGLNCIFSKKFHPDLLREKQLIFCLLTAGAFASQLRGLGVAGEAMCMLFFYGVILYFSFKKSHLSCVLSSGCFALFYALGGEADFMCAALVMCGIICPLINSKHKFLTGLVCLSSCFFGCALGEYTSFFPTLPVCASVCAVMSFLPDKFLKKYNENQEGFSFDSLAVPVRATEISKAVENLGDCVNAVRRTLTPMVTPKLETVLFNAVEKVCSKCEIRDSCINSIRDKNNPHYPIIASALREQRLGFCDFPNNFENTCYCHGDILFSLKQAYFVYCTNINGNNKINRFQQITGNQLRSFGPLLSSICSTAVNSGAVYSKNSNVCVVCAEKMGIDVNTALLCKNQAGHEYFNLSFNKPKDNFNVTRLTENLCRDTGLHLDFPTLIQKDNVYSLIFKQKPKVSFKIAAAMKPATPDGVSGDYYRSFSDSFSRQVVLLSDGMGTGSRAAIDSAFTCETLCNLLKSGLDVKTSARAVNCAMVMKSTDESLATVDLLIADPILASLKIYKCGAAPSFILKDGKTSVLEAESAPMGILDDVDMSKSEIYVSPGDIFLVVSDGIAQERWGWIPAEIKSFRDKSPSALAKHILQCACDRNMGKRPDDMTVIAILVDTP